MNLRERNKRNKYIILSLLLIGISLGYAMITSQLKITGLSKINNASWNIHFDNVVVNTNSVEIEDDNVSSAAVIDPNDNTKVSFHVKLKEPGDFYEFTVDAVNDGSMDAMVDTVVSKLNNQIINELPSYLIYTTTLENGDEIRPNHLLAANTSETYKIRVEFSKEIDEEDLPDEDVSLNFDFQVNFKQKDESLENLVNYQVKHRYQNYDLTTYTEVVENLQGEAGSSVTPNISPREGFNNPSTQTVQISSEGNTIVTYTYSRKSYHFSITDRTYIDNTSTVDGDYLYETEITVKAQERSNYLFKWSDDDTNYERTISLTSDLELTPIYTENFYTLTLVLNGGESTSTNIVVEKGEAVGELPTASKTGYYLDGWYTENSGGEKLTTSYVPTTSKEIYARWKMSVESAIITNSNISINVGEEETINISNSASIEEEYTFTSNDTSIVTVDNTGKVTGVAAGSTTITITGVSSNKTKTVNVTVVDIPSTYRVTFNANGGDVLEEGRDVVIGEEVGDLPTPTNGNNLFDGWYTLSTGGVEIDSHYVPEGNIEVFARWYASNIVAVMDEVGYISIQNAINAVQTDNIQKTIKVLKDRNEALTVASGKNIILNLNGKTNSLTSSSKVITNSGTLEVKNGTMSGTSTNVIVNNGSANLLIKNCTITCSAGSGAVDNKQNGVITIQDTRIEATGSRQALYNEGTSTIKGNSNLSSTTAERATVHNKTGGVVNILNGTITSTGSYAVYNENGSVVIGEKDGVINSSPVIQGKTYGIVANKTYKFYDGIIKGQTNAIGTTSDTGNTPNISIDTERVKISEIEDEAEYVTATEMIGETPYNTLSLKSLSPKYHITLNPNGGSVSPTVINVDQESNIGEIPTPIWEWYTFNGWYTESEGGVEVTSSYVPTGDIEIFAHWTEMPTYNIIFEENGGSSVEDFKIAQGSSITALPTSNRSGYYLDGWYTGLLDGIKVEVGYTPVADLNLVARWKKSVSSMIINPEEILIDSPEGETINIINVSEIEENYTFTSNDTSIVTVDSNGVITPVTEGETTITITGTNSNQTKAVTVKVQYERCTITFDTNGGEEIEDKIIVKYLPIGHLPIAYLDHYYFDGWYTSLQDGIEVDEDYIVQGDMRVFAHYISAPSYTITFDVNGGKAIDETSRVVSADMAIGELPTPTRASFYFDGWKDEVENKSYTSNMQPTKDVTLKAQWSEVKHVARINSTYYPSIQRAIDAAETNDEIVLLVNRTENPTNNKKITLNLDKHEVTGYITNNIEGDLTILNGSIKYTGNNSSDYSVIKNYGFLTIGSINPKLDDGVLIENTNTTSGYISGISSYGNSDITMNGGSITATGTGSSSDAYGIYGYENSTITMNGGSITASGYDSNGIYGDENSTITMNGGSITATGTDDTNGIRGYKNSTITMNGGSITATGTGSFDAHGIYGYENSTITMNGGSITATTGSSSAAYGIGYKNSTITMNGGSITAIGYWSYGIVGNNVTMNGGSITATSSGYHVSGIAGNNESTITMNGGSITATGVDGVEGVEGISSYGNSTITMNGGSITATGNGGSSSGYGIYGTSGSKVTMTDGIIYSKGVNKDNTYGIDSPTKIYPAGKTLYNETSPDNYEVYYLVPTSSGVTVTFNPNGGSVFPTSMSKTSGENIGTLPTPTRTNYDFDGWYNGNDKINSNYVVNSNVTFTAHWTEKPQFTITFDKNNSNATGVMSNQIIYRDANETLTANSYELAGYQFIGWNTKSDGSGTSYLDEDEISLNKNITLYAQWIKVYTLTFDKNNEDAIGDSYSITVVSGVSTQIPDEAFSAFTLTGKKIDSYNTESSNTGTSYYKGQSIVVTQDTTLYAQWIDIPDPVSFADDSWDTIISAAQSGNTSAYTVGSTKEVDMETFGTHTLRVANNSTPAECATEGFSETACGFVLEFADIITTHRMNPYSQSGSVNGDGNKGGWEYSEMRTYVNTDIYNALPTSLKNAIINTTVVSGHGSNDTTNFTTVDKLYLLSTKEVWGKEGTSNVINYDTAEAETRQLDYYKSQNVTTTSYSGAIKQNNGSSSYWWLRSAYSLNIYHFFGVASSGDWYSDISNYTNGVSPAFRIS